MSADFAGILLLVAEAATEIAAESGDNKAIVGDKGFEIRNALCVHIFGSHFTPGSVDLYALSAYLGSLFDCGRDIGTEAVDYNAYRKSAHLNLSLNNY